MSKVLRGCLALLAFAPLAGLAQAQISIPPRPPQLVITGGAEQQVRLQSLRVDAEIAGGLALTRVEMVFLNPNSRVLEGELQFPLLDGQAIAGFALDVDGKLRDAVPVEKARGRAVFEDIARVRVDPGLVEATQGNNFKLRIYPLMPGKTRTVRISYSEALGASRTYRLALAYAEPAPALALNLRVKGSSSLPKLAFGAPEGLKFQRSGSDWTASYSGTAYQKARVLEVELPAARGAVVHTQQLDGQTYFFAEVPVRTRSAPRRAPRVVALAWDSSGSGAARDHGKELALLGAYLRWIGNGEVLLARIRDQAEPLERYRIVDGDWSALRLALRATVYDGATQLGAFSAPAEAEEVLLFSDGLSNFGDAKLRTAGKPVHAISASHKTDPAALRALAEASGGRYIDLLAERPGEAASKLTREWTRIGAVDADDAVQLVRESAYPRQGRIALAGVLQGRSATLRLEILSPGVPKAIVEIPAGVSAEAGTLAAGLWARLRIAELDSDYDLNRAEIRRLGKAFGLVTRETSLIVLERVEDYARHEIAPPLELRADYDRLLKTAAQQRARSREGQLERIVKLLDEKQAWWNRDFPKGDKTVPIAAGKPEATTARQRMEERSDLARDRVASAPAMENRVMGAPAPAALAAGAASMLIGQVASSGDAPSGAQAAIAVRLKAWTPDAPYLRRLREADVRDVYRIYLDEKPGYASSTAFFLDVADLLLEKGQRDLALRVLSNLAEMDLGNRHVLRILGYRLLQAGRPALSIAVFRKVLELAPDEPQSWRDLGLAFAADGQHQKAVEALYEVMVRPWDGRFPEIELITLADLNAIAALAGDKLERSRLDARLLRNLPLDLRVVLTWDADNTDIDLWVIDPNGEKAFYGNRLTYQGGRMSQDFTGGYGPEEFSLKSAKPGKYRIQAQFYGHRQQIVAGATTLQVKLATHFGTPAAEEKLITLRLAGQSEIVEVGEFEVSAKKSIEP